MSHYSAVRLYATLAGALVLSLFASSAHAQFTPRPVNDPATGERYHIEGAAALWFPSIDLTVNSEQFGIAGSQIDFKKDLGAEDHKIGDLRLVLRPTKRSKFRFEYIPISYQSTANGAMANAAAVTLSLHACTATRGTCRREASSKAIAVAPSEAGEPSMPTSTGRPAYASSKRWTTVSGQCD